MIRALIVAALIVVFILADPIQWLVYWVQITQWNAANPNHGSPY